MLLDEFLIGIGLKVDRSSISDAEALGDAVDGVGESAQDADQQLGSFGSRISNAFGSALSVVGVAAAAIKTALLGAIAFFDGYISKAEDYYNSKDEDLKITKEQLEMAKKYEEGLSSLGNIIESIRVKVAFSFLPAMLKTVETFNNLIEKNRDLIANGLSKLLSVLAYISQAITNTVRFIDLVITRTVGWEKALYILGAALLYVRRASILAFITNPIALVVAAIAGLIILIDDFITYLDGGESEFGSFWGAMLEYIEIITPALKKLWDVLGQGAYYLIELGFFVTKYLGGAFVDAVETIAAVWALLIGLLTGDFNLIGVAWNGLIENLLSAFSNLAMLFEPIAQLITKIISSAFEKAKVYVFGVLSQIITAITGFVSKIGSVISTVFTIITTPFRLAFDWIVNTFSKIPSLIGNIISKLPGVNAITSIGSAVSSGASRIVNNYGGSTSANINVTAPNAISAANQTASALQNLTAQRNVGGEAYA